MPSTLINESLEPVQVPAETFPRKVWTVRECHRLVNDGILDGAKYELIEGDIVRKMGQGRLHIIVITSLSPFLSDIFGAAFIQTQAPIGIGEIQETSDPEPDIAVLSRPVREFARTAPNPSIDVRLVVEVADTTLRGDTTVKARLYARAGISDYWVVDVSGRRLLVFRDPSPEGYRERTVYTDSESVTPLAAMQSEIRIADFLP